MDLSVVDDSHGYCRVSSKSDTMGQKFDPVIINHICNHNDHFDENTLEYHFYRKNYNVVVTQGELLLPSLPRNAIRRSVLELLTRSHVHLSKKQKALEFLKYLVEENRTEDASRDFLRMWAYERLEMYEECIEGCRDYLKVRSGDLNAVQMIIRCMQKVGLDASEWQRNERQILNCFARPNHNDGGK